MHINILKIAVGLGIIFGIYSCTKTLNTVTKLNIPHTPHLVIECEKDKYLVDSTLLGLTASRGITDTGFCPVVYNATIKLYENNVFKSDLLYDAASEDFYISSFNQYVSGNTYKISASANGYETITAEDKMPSALNIISKQVTRKAKQFNFEQNGNQWYDEVKIVFQDNASTTDYYGFTFGRTSEQVINSTGWGVSVYTTDKDLDASEDGDIGGQSNFYYSKMYMKDSNFNGQTKTFTAYLPNSFISWPDTSSKSTWYVRMENLSENAYKYEKSEWLYKLNDGNPFAEPVQIHNNVINGNGSFRLKSTLVDSL
jgi:Domain of unknown function (DUF4249)